jgi:DNA-binding response OmpR family regulator
LKAGDGEAGLAAARAERPDVILLDVMMPKMTGDVVCKALKADPQYRQIPIIMLTAKSQEADRAHGLACGADAYMGKPFESKALLAAIQQQLERAAEQQS